MSKSFFRIIPVLFAALLSLTCTPEETVIKVESVTLDAGKKKLEVGGTHQLTATVSPFNATNKKVIWSSDSPDVATVSQTGLVEAVGVGVTTVKATSDDGNKSATCEITVEAKVYKVKDVTLDKTEHTVKVGDEFTLTATIKPDNATNKEVTWESSDESVATVEDGKVKALKVGTTTITVKTDDGDKTATCDVTVKDKNVPVAGVTLDETSHTLEVGKSFTLTATIEPDDATNKEVTWESSDESVATVEDGKVTALKVGTTTITVKTKDGNKTANCDVTVEEKTIPVTGVTLDKTEHTVEVGDEFTLTATIKPDNATNKEVTWESSDESVATVEDGKVKALKVGTTTITVKTDDGDKTATCDVKVEEKTIPVTGVTLDKTAHTLEVGEYFTLTATIKPDNATNKDVTWESSNTSVATVEDGKVTALKVGTTTITVKTDDGDKTATCDVTVKDKNVPVTGVTLNKTAHTLEVGESFTLTATIKPDNATNKDVTWKSSNTSVATVEDGKVTALKVGTTTITVKTKDGNKTATCKVTVDPKTIVVTGVKLDKTTHTMTEGETVTLVATIEPDNATNKDVTWESSNTSVAAVDAEGKVTAKKAGNVRITVKTVDGNHEASCDIVVKKAYGNGSGEGVGEEEGEW